MAPGAAHPEPHVPVEMLKAPESPAAGLPIDRHPLRLVQRDTRRWDPWDRSAMPLGMREWRPRVCLRPDKQSRGTSARLPAAARAGLPPRTPPAARRSGRAPEARHPRACGEWPQRLAGHLAVVLAWHLRTRAGQRPNDVTRPPSRRDLNRDAVLRHRRFQAELP